MAIVQQRTELEITVDAGQAGNTIKTDLIAVVDNGAGPIESNTIPLTTIPTHLGRSLIAVADNTAERLHKFAKRNNDDAYVDPLSIPVFAGIIPDLDLIIDVLMTPVDYSGYFTNGGVPTSYAMTTVPTGCAFDTVTCILSGTPTALSGTNPFVSATNANGTADSNVFNIAVAAA